MADKAKLDFYTDPLCPWAWRTALWARRVTKERPVDITWKIFSLAIANSPEDYKKDDHHAGDMELLRTLALARRRGGNDAFERLYIAYGNAQHGRREKAIEPAVQAVCLKEAGLPATLFDEAQADPTTETEVIEEHKGAAEKLGAFGVPTLALEGSDIGIFGPVIEPVPSGEDAGKLWDNIHYSLQQSNLYETKRIRRGGRLGPQFAD